MTSRLIVPAVVFLLILSTPTGSFAQGRGAAAGNARSVAPFDLTGYWVSLVTDDWRYRMLTPPKGNVDYLPVNAEGRRLAEAWDPAKDEASGEQCKAYGAVGVMRMPGRLHIAWENETTLKLEADAGTQTRRFVFGTQAAPTGRPTWQGHSTARWATPAGGRGDGAARHGELQVTTTHMRPGYIRKNGIPYSGSAQLREFFVRLVDDDEQVYLAVTQLLDDPAYLTQPIVRTMLFKKQADASGWKPTPCSAR